MRATVAVLTVSAALLAGATASRAQATARQDAVMSRIQREAQERSQLYPLAQTLMDSIGPRLVGSIEQRRANEWVLSMYREVGDPGAERALRHLERVAPRDRARRPDRAEKASARRHALDVESGDEGRGRGRRRRRNPTCRTPPSSRRGCRAREGKFVLLNFPWPTCRPDAELKEYDDAGDVRADAGRAHRGVRRVVRRPAPIGAARHRARASVSPRRARSASSRRSCRRRDRRAGA